MKMKLCVTAPVTVVMKMVIPTANEVKVFRLFEEYPERFQFVEGITEIFPDLFYLTEMVSRYPRPKD
jgi:hypothetical protein